VPRQWCQCAHTANWVKQTTESCLLIQRLLAGAKLGDQQGPVCIWVRCQGFQVLGRLQGAAKVDWSLVRPAVQLAPQAFFLLSLFRLFLLFFASLIHLLVTIPCKAPEQGHHPARQRCILWFSANALCSRADSHTRWAPVRLAVTATVKISALHDAQRVVFGPK
jgi:hypothetical protein